MSAYKAQSFDKVYTNNMCVSFQQELMDNNKKPLKQEIISKEVKKNVSQDARSHCGQNKLNSIFVGDKMPKKKSEMTNS